MAEKKVILVVDDDPDLIEIYTLLLEKEGYLVETAFDSKSGFLAVKAHLPDLMILDIMMENPDSGFELAQKISDNGYTVPIILSSSIAKAVAELFDMESLNIKGIIQKTAAFTDLVAMVKRLLPA